MENILDNARSMDFRLRLVSAGLNRLVKELFEQIPNPQKQHRYQGKLRKCLRIILINLIGTAQSTNGWVSYSRNANFPEYRLKDYSAKTISKVTDFLHDNLFIEHKPGFMFEGLSRMSRMRATPKLKELFASYSLTQTNIEWKEKGNRIILRDEMKRDIPFKRTDFTNTMLTKLKKINEQLKNHNLVLPNEYQINRKAYNRIFNIDFDHGGRFYGPEWQWMKGEDRRSIRIDGSPLIELDYTATHPTLLYALKGKSLSIDPYQLNESTPEERGFLKRITLVLINVGDPIKARRAVQRLINIGELEKPPSIEDLNGLINEFMAKHQPIQDLFNPKVGMYLQRLESDLCEALLIEFADKGIPVLSVHDSFLVPREYNVPKSILCKLFSLLALHGSPRSNPQPKKVHNHQQL